MPRRVAFKAPHEVAIATLDLRQGKTRADTCLCYLQICISLITSRISLMPVGVLRSWRHVHWNILPCTCALSGWGCAPSDWWTDCTGGTAWCSSPADSAPKSNDTLPRLRWPNGQSPLPPPGSHCTPGSDSRREVWRFAPKIRFQIRSSTLSVNNTRNHVR